MLRTTVSRFKKVCSGALISRILRGDPCCGQVSCAVVRKSFESTKSTDDGKKVTAASDDKKKSKGTASLEKSSTKCSRIEEPNIPLTQREKCQKIIDKSFGACEHTEHVAEVTPTYFSHNINLEDTRREIIKSERAKMKLKEEVKIENPLRPPQYTLFKMSRELIKDDNHDEIEFGNDSMGKVPPAAQGLNLTDKEDLVKTLNVHMTTAKEPDLTKHSDGIETAEDVAPHLDSCLRIAKDHDEKCLNNPESVENKPLRDDEAETIELVKDDRKQYMYEKAIPKEKMHTLLPYNNRNLFDAYSLLREDENQDDIILMHSMMRLPPIGFSLTGEQNLLTKVKNVEECVKNLERVENKTQIKMDNDEKKHMFINATTAKEEQEQLTQKLETIEETPLVEAQRPKIEGFNVTPRVLGDQPVVNSKSTENDKVYFPRKPMIPGGDLDDVAKRCLNCPLGRIDEILLNEMEKSPFTSKIESNVASKALLGDMVIKAEELKRQPNSKIAEKEIHSESRKIAMNHEEPHVVGLTSPRRQTANIINTKATLSQLQEKDLRKDEQNVQFTKSPAEKQTTHSEATSFDSQKDATSPRRQTANIVNTKATLSELQEKDLRKDEQNVQCTKSPAVKQTTHCEATSFDSQKDATSPGRQTANIVNTKATLSELQEKDLRKVEQNAQCSKSPAEKQTTHSKALLFDSQKDATSPRRQTANIVNTKATLSELQEKDLRKVEQNAQCSKSPAEKQTTHSKALLFDSQKDATSPRRQTANIVNTKATLSGLQEKDLRKVEQNTQCSKSPAEKQTTHSEAISFDSQKDASRLPRCEILQPETHNTVKASNIAKDELQSKETEQQPLYSHNLSTSYMWGQTQQNASDFKTRYLQQGGETNAIEHGQTPQAQNMEQNSTANRGFEGVPYTNFRYPGHSWENTVDHMPKVNTATPIESHQTSCLKEEPQLKAGQEYERISVTDGVLREYELDPYYVLACNETCPIAPFSTLSTYNHTDFVDTTETIYMKKNICETLRPKARPRDEMTPSENRPSDTPAIHEIDVQFEPEVIPEGYTAIPEPNKPVNMMDVKDNLPQLSDKVSLSELLKRVRERSRLECISDLNALSVSAEPTVGKCNRRAPRCPPMAPRSPPLNPVPPPSFGLPMLKRRPPVCKAPKKKGGCKCTACDMDVSCGVQMGKVCPEMAYELNEAEVIALRSKADLTEVVADRLHNLGKAISGVLRRAKSSTETLFARDYDPWAPIPSWPSPQKGGKKKWQPGVPCNYRCPVYPKARASMNTEPPCDLKPCQGFPKRRAFSMLDCFAVSLDDVEVK